MCNDQVYTWEIFYEKLGGGRTKSKMVVYGKLNNIIYFHNFIIFMAHRVGLTWHNLLIREKKINIQGVRVRV
jgi:hypothetical protein